METLSPPQLPLTFEARADLPDVLRVPATLDEYWELVEILPYRIEYLDGEIISDMGQATDTHETLVGTLIRLFGNYFEEAPDYRVMGSNIKIFSEACQASFNADLSVVRGPSEFKVLPSGRLSRSNLLNPEIVVEVLSDSTEAFDLTGKLSCYKSIPTLQYIVFVGQKAPWLSVYARTDLPNQWLNTDSLTLDGVAILGELRLPLRDVYRKVPF